MNTQYNKTRHASFLLNYHFIWIPKYRKSFLNDDNIKTIILDSLKELSEKHDFQILETEIMPDHIHLFISAIPKYSPAQLINIIKGTTGKRILEQHPQYRTRSGSIWTRSYFVASAGNISSDTIKNYIQSQTKSGDKCCN
jgi:putative transposase